MACINISAVSVLNDPAPFTAPLSFAVEYECTQELQEDLEWKMIYVVSETEEYDQVLESIMVGPVYAGQYKFVFEGNAPDASRLPAESIVGSSAVLLTVSYRVGGGAVPPPRLARDSSSVDMTTQEPWPLAAPTRPPTPPPPHTPPPQDKEFIRIGYFVEVGYEDEALQEAPPATPDLARLTRRIEQEHPRVTRFPNSFDSPEEDMPPVQDEPGEEECMQVSVRARTTQHAARTHARDSATGSCLSVVNVGGSTLHLSAWLRSNARATTS